eukprot:jgi/Phyca11/539283/estExt2_Genewise1Plus.C_PHYCAscaffold_30197
MVGLSASELQAETLFPGDTIEYYSMAFVAGDKRGHRVSKVLRVNRKDDEFPIRVDTQEMLPLTIMLKRKLDRNDVEISSDGETTSSQRSSLEKISTPERKKKKRKPMTPRENYERNQAQNKLDIKKNRAEEKSPQKDSSEVRPKQKFKYDKPESRKLKRKRSDSTLITPKQAGSAPNQPTISKFFSKKQHRQKKRKSFDVMKFVSHAEEKEEIMPSESRKLMEIEQAKQQKDVDLDRYLTLENKQQAVVKKVKDRMETSSKAGDIRAASNRSDSPRKKAWKKQLSNFRQSNAGSNMDTWLKPLGKPKNVLEEISGGTPTKPKERGKQRILNLTPDKQYSPKMNRKNMNFMMNSSSSAYKSKEGKQRMRVDSPSKQNSHLLKKRGSLGTVSARVRLDTSLSCVIAV